MLSQADVVHVRLLLLALEDQGAWNNAVANLCTLLKPGAWLQWEEGSFDEMKSAFRHAGTPGKGTGALLRGFKRLADISGERLRHVPQKLLRAFEAAGLQDLEVDTVASDRLSESGREVGTRVEIGALEGMMKQQREAMGQGQALANEDGPEDDERLLEAMRMEMNDGTYVVFPMHCITGRKPS
ncbi:MAG: hypothetical protein Q9159_000130 [Coniocarpon cinnabarinum]